MGESIILAGASWRPKEMHFRTLALLASAILPVVAGTALTSAQVQFAVIGDYGVDNANQLAVANAVKATSASFVATTGDNTYFVGANDSAKFANWDKTQGKYYAQYIKLPAGSAYTAQGAAVNKFFPSMGNHDWDEGQASYLNYFSNLPQNPSGNSRYYSYREGPVEIFVLSADSREPAGRTPGSTQYTWAEQAIRASTAAWQIVTFHQPAYTYSSNHSSETAMRWNFKSWGVDAVFSGHNHNMQAMTVTDSANAGLPYFVQGASGNSLYSINGGPSGATGNFSNTSSFGFTLNTVTNDNFTVEFKNTSGTTLHSTNLTKFSPTDNPPPPPPATPVSLPAAGYSQNFNSIGATGTTPPTGWRHFTASGSNTTFVNPTATAPFGISPVTLALTPANTAGTTLVANNSPTANQNNGYNAQGTSSTDRVLATAPTSIAAAILQLSLTNDTGASLTGLEISYDIRRYNAPATANELPGFQLFYSVNGGANWNNVFTLNPTLGTSGTILVPNTVGVTSVPTTTFYFAGAPVLAGGNLLLRWVDDNADQTSPDQIVGLDNVVIAPRSNLPPVTNAAALPLSGYSQNFNSMGTAGTAAPLGFAVHVLAGADSTFGAAGVPAIAAGDGLPRGPLTAASNPTALNNNGYNAASAATPLDRALATAPTGVGAAVLELALTNTSVFLVEGFRIAYDIRQFNVNGVEEAPGYRLTYSLDNGITWTPVPDLNPVVSGGPIVMPNAAGTTSIPLTAISLTSAIPSNGNLLLRWIDDNAVPNDPVIGLDNLVVQPIARRGVLFNAVTPAGPADAVSNLGQIAFLSIPGLDFGTRTLAVTDANIESIYVALDLVGTPEAIEALLEELDLEVIPVDPAFGSAYDAVMIVDGRSTGGLVRVDWNFAGSGVTLAGLAVVPEPASLALLLPAAALISRRRR
jgi:hypothetical protein